MTAEHGNPAIVPTMVFDSRDNHSFNFPHDDPMAIGLKVASILVRRILNDIESSTNIIT